LWVMLIDIGKGWLATRVIAPFHATQPFGWVAVACGIAAIIGHVYPIWYGFRGGKGVATLVGAALGLDAWLLLPMLLTWLVVVMLSGFVGLGSMLGALGLAAAGALGSWEPRAPLITFGVLTAILVAFTHRSNIARMRAGTEPRAMRLWLFGRRQRSG
jgi:glycerol-3-phosphate acyltransferase PlsY